MERAWGGGAWAEAASEASATRTPKAWQYRRASGRKVLEGGTGAPVCPTLRRSPLGDLLLTSSQEGSRSTRMMRRVKRCLTGKSGVLGQGSRGELCRWVKGPP